MKENKHLIRPLLVFFIFVVFLFSCRKDDGPDFDYFVSNDHIYSFSQAAISAVIDNAVKLYPELNDIKPYLTSGINVYKMVYNTRVDGKEIEASGLVCVPDINGEYPVLSFQNGTNTVKAYAPSEYPINPDYQLIEYIASMGFVVIIPDYPGFGKSSQISHPYLIAEPTVQSVVDMLRGLNEGMTSGFPGISIKDEYYLLGYSQGGWATLTLHKALEKDYFDEFTLMGSACGAGSYMMNDLFQVILASAEYPMPSYLGYIINAYSVYDQFTNPVTDILNEPYAARLSSLYAGTLTLGQINSQLTTSISGLFKPEFLSGYASSATYSSVREALIKNSISAWNSSIPLFFGHGEGDTHVSVTTTENMYDAMIAAGTSATLCKKVLYPDLDHGDAAVPCLTDGVLFLINIRDQ